MEPTFRIFVSSPGDVAEERALAERVIVRLAQEWAHSLPIAPFLWEHEPLRATATYQDEIGSLCRPSEADVVVCLLWCRFGSRLPPGIARPDGTPYSSGTEYELEDAAAGYERTGGRPTLLVYKKTARLLVEIDDPHYAERRRQKDALDAFLQGWSQNADGTARRAVHHFQETSDFEDLLEQHLGKLLVRAAEGAGAQARTAPSWRESPFRGLAVFEPRHAPIFFGRTAAASAVVKAARERDARGVGFVSVVGASGCGKSSLLRAGVLSLLTTRGVVPEVGLWRQAVLIPGDRDSDPFRGLAAALTDGDALPELTSGGLTVEELGARFRETPAGFGLAVEGGLRQAAAVLQRERGLEKPPAARLALVVDQMEQLFTLPGLTAADRARFIACLGSAVQLRAAVVLATVRRDFVERCHEIPELLSLMQGDGQYQLQSPGPAELERIITRPAALAGLDFESGSEDRLSLDQRLRDAALEHPHSLPLLEFALDQLYERRTPQGRLTHTAYEEMGELEGAVATHAEQAFQAWSRTVAPGAAEPALGLLLQSLVTVQPETEQFTASRLAEGKLESGAARDLAGALVAARLLVRDSDQAGQPVLTVAHEAVFREWPRARAWLDRNLEFLRARARVEADRQRYEASSPKAESRDPGFLIPAEGRRLAEAEELLRKHPADLEPATRDFIKASVQRAAASARWRRSGYAALLVLLLGTAFGVYAVLQSRQLARERGLAIAYRLAAQAELVRAEQPGLSALLAAESLKRHRGVEADGALRRSLALLPELVSEQEVGTIKAVSAAPGTYVVEHDRQQGLRVFDPVKNVRSGWLLGELRDELTLSETHVTPDGGRLVNLTQSPVNTNRLRVVAVATGAVEKVDVDGYFSRTALSPDGRWLAAASQSRLRSWDLQASPPRVHEASMVGKGDPGQPMFSPDSLRLAVSAGSAVYVFDPVLNEQAAVPARVANSIAVRLGQVAVATARDICFNTLSGKPSSCLSQDRAEHIAFDRSGMRLALAEESGVVRVLDVASSAQVARFAHEGRVTSVRWNGPGTLLAAITENHVIHVWDVEHEREVARLSDEARILWFDAALTTVSNALRIRRWSLHEGLVEDRRLPHRQSVHDAVFVDGNRWIVTGSGYDGDDETSDPDYNVRIWPLDRAAEAIVLPQGQAVGAVRVVQGGKYLLAAGRWHVIVSDLEQRRVTAALPCRGEVDDIAMVAFTFALSADGRRLGCLAESEEARAIQVYSIPEGHMVGTAFGIEDAIASVALDADGSRMALSEEGALQVRDIASGRELARVPMEAPALPSFVGPDRLVVTSESDVRFYDLRRRAWEGLKINGPVTLAVRAASQHLLLVNEATATIHDASSGAAVASFGHSSEIRDAILSGDGRLLVTVTADDVAHVWDVATRQERVRVQDSIGHGSLYRVVLSADARFLATTHDREVRVWRLEPKELLSQACARVKGNLTAAEWEAYVGAGEPCRATCPDLPACQPKAAEGEAHPRLHK
jgi:WD40 repeat protein